MRRLLTLLGCLLASCYSPQLASPGFYCHPNDNPACPDGQKCVGDRCVNESADGGVRPRDMSMPTDGGMTMPDMTSGGTCVSTAMCTGATSLGSINADSGGTLSGMGEQSAWLTAQAVENNNGLTGQRMRIQATLTSPATTNFDLYVYLAIGGSAPECTTVMGSSTATGTSDVVNIDWGETDGSLPNGSSDNALVTFEVRPAAGATCTAGKGWTLDIKGGP